MLAVCKTLVGGIRRHLLLPTPSASVLLRPLSSGPTSGDGGSSWSGPSGPIPGDWDSLPSWSTGITGDHFDGTSTASVGRMGDPYSLDNTTTATSSHESAVLRAMDEEEKMLRELERSNTEEKLFVDSWKARFRETCALLKQVRDPGSRGSYLKDSEKKEMYKLHKEDPKTYTVERLAEDFRVMRQRVQAILWLQEMEEEDRKQGKLKLDDSVEELLDAFPEFFNFHCREFHVARLRYKPEFKVMPEGWDGAPKDPDEVHYDISVREDNMLHEEFLLRLEFNKKKVAGEVKCHPYSRIRPARGWNLIIEMLGPAGKRSTKGGWKFVSMPDGSTRPLNAMEKMYLKRETPRRRRPILAPYTIRGGI